MTAGVKQRDWSRGSATLELAVLLPLLLVGTLGIADFGRIYYHMIAVSNAAHAGAKYGAHSPQNMDNESGITVAVLNELGDYADETVGVEATRYCTCRDGTEVNCEAGVCGFSGEPDRIYIKVRVQKPVEPLFPYPGMPETVLLSRDAYVRAQ